LKFPLRVCGTHCRNFKSAALERPQAVIDFYLSLRP
jgi:hypothetical protein